MEIPEISKNKKEIMKTLWTVDGDETSWTEWAEGMADAPASPAMGTMIHANKAEQHHWALDLGCGTGRAFLPLTQAGYKVIGIDPNPRGIQLSQRRAGKESLAAIPLLASASAIPIQSGQVDFIFAVGVLFHLSLPELKFTLREIRRVLNPAGKALLHFLDLEDWRKTLAASVPEEEVPYPGYRSVVTCFCSRQVIEGWIAEAGLSVISMELEISKKEGGEQRSWFPLCKA
jgi:SAM-dependent methyltransferase